MLAFALAALRRVIDWTIICLYAFMCLAILAQVLGRYLFDFTIGGAVESATFAQTWMVLLAAGVAMRWGLHNSMDILASRLSAPIYRVLVVISGAACLWFLWVAIKGSFPLLRIGTFQTSPALGLPMWVPYLAVPVGFAYLALETLLFSVQRLRAGAPPAGMVDGGEVS